MVKIFFSLLALGAEKSLKKKIPKNPFVIAGWHQVEDGEFGEEESEMMAHSSGRLHLI